MLLPVNDDPKNMVEIIRLCREYLTTINHEHDERIFNRRRYPYLYFSAIVLYEAKNITNNLTMENQTVLDAMMGTGTTGITALELNRNSL